MNKKEINFRDPVVEAVVNKFVFRSDVGFAKYGKTLRDDDSDLFTWVNHLQEELMDAVLYMQRLKEEIANMKEEKLLRDIEYIDIYGMETVVNTTINNWKSIENTGGLWVSNTTNSHLNLRNDNSKD
jgi:hypothetical protein